MLYKNISINIPSTCFIEAMKAVFNGIFAMLQARPPKFVSTMSCIKEYFVKNETDNSHVLTVMKVENDIFVFLSDLRLCYLCMCAVNVIN